MVADICMFWKTKSVNYHVFSNKLVQPKVLGKDFFLNSFVYINEHDETRTSVPRAISRWHNFKHFKHPERLILNCYKVLDVCPKYCIDEGWRGSKIQDNRFFLNTIRN